MNKEIETDFGVTTNFHKILEMTIFEDGSARVQVVSYWDQNAYENGNDPLTSNRYNIPKGTFLDLNQKLLTESENWIMQNIEAFSYSTN